eukprot:scaffold80575_cov63-Phaeocystis_antarctica.AAC.2
MPVTRVLHPSPSEWRGALHAHTRTRRGVKPNGDLKSLHIGWFLSKGASALSEFRKQCRGTGYI